MMKMLLPLCLLALLLPAFPAVADDAGEIRTVFATCKEQLLAGQTTQAAGALAPSVNAYYEQLKSQALKGASSLPASTPSVDRLLIEILLQHAGSKLANQTLADVAANGLHQGWIKLDGLQDVQLGTIHVTGQTATGALLVKGKPTSWSAPFLKTPDGWKLDPLALYRIGDFLLKTEIARNGFNEQKTIHAIAASLNAKKKS